MSADKQKLTPVTKSQQEFMNLSTEMLKAATSFAMFWGKGIDDYVLWKILGDSENITNNEFKPPEAENVINTGFNFSTDDFTQNFFSIYSLQLQVMTSIHRKLHYMVTHIIW